jgi:hypothetical protein
MNNTDPYESWLERKRDVQPSPELIDNIMDRVLTLDAEQRTAVTRPPPRIQRLLQWISLRPFAQAAVIAAGGIIGVLRLFAAFQFILSY